MCIIPFIAVQLNSEEMVLHRFSSSAPDRSLEYILYLAAGTELVEAGISSSRRNRDYNYILQTDYTVDGKELRVDYSLYSMPNTAQPAAAAAFNMHIDHDIDTQVGIAVQKLLTDAGIEVETDGDAEIEGLFADTPQTEDSKIEPPAPADEPEMSQLPDEERKTPIEQAAESPKEAYERILTSSFSPAGFLFFGEMTDFFHYGLGSRLNVGANWWSEKHGIMLELDITLLRVFNNRGVIGGPLYISMSGIKTGFVSGSVMSHRFTAALRGGAAFLSAAGNESLQTKTVPYAGVDLFSGVPLGQGFYVGGALGFLLIFDDDSLLSALSPSVQLQKEF